MACDFSEKEQKNVKKGKIFENLGTNVKIFWKMAGDCVQLSHVINCKLD